MELTPQQALELANIKRRQVLESVDKELETYRQAREEQIKLSGKEKSALSTLVFTIAAILMSFKPDILDNCFILIGLGILAIDSFVFGFVADWFQRGLNAKNYEDAMKTVVREVRPFFDAYDAFISKEPPDQTLFNMQQDAYIGYLEAQKNRSSKFQFAKRFWLNIGSWYLFLYAIGLLFIGIGLLQNTSCLTKILSLF